MEKKRTPQATSTPLRSKREVKPLRQAPPRSTEKATRPPRAREPSRPSGRRDEATRPSAEPRTARRGASSVRNARPPLSSHPSAQLPPPRIPTPPPVVPRSMELEWDADPGPPSQPSETSFDRWVRRGDALLRQLAQHGAADHEYRLSLRDRRFWWVDPRGHVSVEARAELLCTFVPRASCVTMGWADPRTRAFSLRAIPGMPAEVDAVDEEAAWQIAMAAADHTGAEFLYRVRTADQCLFVGLSRLDFGAPRSAFVPCTPVAMVLSTLGEARVATELGAEPVDTIRERLRAAGAVLLEQAEFAHRDTDWVAPLVRTGHRLRALSDRLPRDTFFSVAKGASTVWLDRGLANDLVESIALLEEEWRQFG